MRRVRSVAAAVGALFMTAVVIVRDLARRALNHPIHHDRW